MLGYQHATVIEGVEVPIHLIGDSAFKLQNCVMRPFSSEQPESEKVFNKRISSVRRVAENAFGHLKARFRRIGRDDGVDGILSVSSSFADMSAEATNESEPVE
ncbi:uncharacterized protein LOC128922691 [Zeugodacus cucurbitae]|uniref:uncharacterized protein LOC128922691 n=1 Tax=Zeugodacus cucurbitae TaxID=28588 RepID=UPI0023D919AE|nr:uncharacterized protein LOC128922691 [Zeugodacus cucurbitae]